MWPTPRCLGAYPGDLGFAGVGFWAGEPTAASLVPEPGLPVASPRPPHVVCDTDLSE